RCTLLLESPGSSFWRFASPMKRSTSGEVCHHGHIFVFEVASRPPALPPARPPCRAGVLGGVTAGAAVLSCGVQVILDQGVDDESVCGRSDGSDWKAAGAASGCRGS